MQTFGIRVNVDDAENDKTEGKDVHYEGQNRYFGAYSVRDYGDTSYERPSI